MLTGEGIWLFAVGVVSILGQVVLLRELSVTLYGSELVYILAMGVWLVWSAGGAAAGRRRRLPAVSLVRVLLVAVAVAVPAMVALARGVRLLFASVPGADLSFARQLAAVGIILLPAGLLGLLFQWSAKLQVSRGATLARAYAVESAGGLAGGVLSALLLHAGVQNLTQAGLASLVSALAALVPWRAARPRWTLPAVLAVSATLLAGLAARERLDAAMTAWAHPHLAATRDSPYGRVTVAEAAGQLSVFENDALAFDTESTGAEELVHVAALQHAAPRRVLVLGGGIEGLVEQMLAHQPERIDYVELNQAVIALVESRLPEATRAALAHPAVRVTVEDPRRFLARRGAPYDLILVGMPEPTSAQTSRFYTREFFARAAERLSRRGVLAFRLRGGDNLWTPHHRRRAASIHRALTAVFTDVLVLPATTHILLASRSPLVRDPDLLAGRFEARALHARLVSAAYLGYLLTNDRFTETAAALATTPAEPNTDARPACYPYTLMLWLSKFAPSLMLVDLGELGALVPSWSLVAALGLAAALLALARRTRLLRSAVLVGIAGLAGMVLESTIILRYQMARGVLFEHLGLLLTLFMAGLTLGAWGVERLHARGFRPRRFGAALVAGLALLGLVQGWTFRSELLSGLVASGLVLLAAGALVAGVLAWASLRWMQDQVAIVGPLYAADLLGGAIGSLAASLVLVPLLGMDGTSLLAAVVAALGLLLV